MKHTKQLFVSAFAVLFSCVIGHSQTPVPFKVRYHAFVKGDMAVIANSIVNRTDYNNPTSVPYHNQSNHALLNDQFQMEYIDVDNDGGTFSSSSASLVVNNPENKKIIYAALYWSATYKYNTGIQKSEEKFVADDNNRENIDDIKIKFPNQEKYTKIKGEILFDGLGKKEFKECAPYAVYADITQYINQLDNPFGEYTVANVRATEGKISGGVAAGWTLFVVYRDASMKGKYITSYDGFSGLNDDFTEVPFSGFTTLPQGEVNAKIALAVLEGDNNLTGDQFFFKVGENDRFSVLETANRKAKNFLNGSITINDSHFLDRKPDGKNTLGYDTCMMNITNLNNSVIGNNVNKATLRMKSSGDRCYMFFSAFDIEVTEDEDFKSIATPEIYVSNETDLSEFVAAKKEVKTQAEKPIVIRKNSTEIKSASIDGFSSGYYIIANVFENDANLKNFVSRLNSKGLTATSFLNPNNQINYVYLAKTTDKSMALDLCNSKLNNTYKDPVWILSVNNKEDAIITNLDE
ncbi:SPOR domain-containing protein [Flavobacterium sp.]|uniref:SPOR domain-containing protein n=1 Tax=Flavobacterium sp. TaxID=239 RepID=UPI002B4B07C3|nr:SPOR domain-containing protein [Flavobacterium sp.]HLP63285.1 SPOR domain-containing protein [Flavobacterium sp.]